MFASFYQEEYENLECPEVHNKKILLTRMRETHDVNLRESVPFNDIFSSTLSFPFFFNNWNPCILKVKTLTCLGVLKARGFGEEGQMISSSGDPGYKC